MRQRRHRGADAEEREFSTLYERQNKNRLTQLLLVLGFPASIVGGSLVIVGSWVGFVLVIVGVPLTVALGIWASKNWNYQRSKVSVRFGVNRPRRQRLVILVDA